MGESEDLGDCYRAHALIEFDLVRHSTMCRGRRPVYSGCGVMRFSQIFRWRLFLALWGFFIAPGALIAQESGSPRASHQGVTTIAQPSPQAPSYQWVLSGPFYRYESTTIRAGNCCRSGVFRQMVYTPYYVYVLTQVEEKQHAAAPAPAPAPASDYAVPVPGHEAPFVGNPGRGSVR